MSIVFLKYDDERSVEHKVTDEDMTWPDLSEDFFSFLQGCGYVLSREDFADYWSQYLPDPVDADPIRSVYHGGLASGGGLNE